MTITTKIILLIIIGVAITIISTFATRKYIKNPYHFSECTCDINVTGKHYSNILDAIDDWLHDEEHRNYIIRFEEGIQSEYDYLYDHCHTDHRKQQLLAARPYLYHFTVSESYTYQAGKIGEPLHTYQGNRLVGKIDVTYNWIECRCRQLGVTNEKN